MDDTLQRQIGTTSCSHALILMGNFKHWRSYRAEHKQPRRFLEFIGDDFFLQVTEEETRRGALLDLILAKKEGFFEDVKVSRVKIAG